MKRIMLSVCAAVAALFAAVAAQAGENLIANGSFEVNPSGGPTTLSDSRGWGFVAKGDTACWLGGGTLVPDKATHSSGNATWLNITTVPDGHFVCGLQSQAMCSNRFTVAKSGHYKLTFKYTGRSYLAPSPKGDGKWNGQIVHVELDAPMIPENEIVSFSATTYKSWESMVVADIQIAAGEHWLIFRGDTQYDKTTFVDTIVLERLPQFGIEGSPRCISDCASPARLRPRVVDRDTKEVLTEGVDYDLELSENTSPGTAHGVVRGRAETDYSEDVLEFTYGICDTMTLPYTSLSYATNALVAQFDGVENAARGVHNPSVRYWTDLTGNGWDFTLTHTRAQFDDDRLVMRQTTTNGNEPPVGYAAKGLLAGKYSTIEMVWMPFNSVYSVLNVGNINYGFFSCAKVVQFGDQNGTDKWRYDDPSIVSGVVTCASCVYEDTTSTGKKGYVNGVAVARSTKTATTQYPASTTYSWLAGESSATDWGASCALYAMRFYDRKLTAAEIAANYKIDAIRFKGAAVETNLVVTAAPLAAGEVYPAYGSHTEIAAGDTVVCHAPAACELAGMALACAGYVLSTNSEDGAWIAWQQGTTNEVSYVQPSSAVRLEWRWNGGDELGFSIPTAENVTSSGAEISVQLLSTGGLPSVDVSVAYGPASDALTVTNSVATGVTEPRAFACALDGLPPARACYVRWIAQCGDKRAESRLLVFRTADGDEPEPDPSLPVVSIVKADGSGGDTLVITGRVDSLGTGGSCELRVRTRSVATGVERTWTGMADVDRSETGGFEFTLFDEEDAFVPGEEYEVTVLAVCAAGTFYSRSAVVTTSGAPQVMFEAFTDDQRFGTYGFSVQDAGAGQGLRAELWVGTSAAEDEMVRVVDLAGEQVAPRVVTSPQDGLSLNGRHPDAVFGGTYYVQIRVYAETAGGTASWERRSEVRSFTAKDTATYYWNNPKAPFSGKWTSRSSWGCNKADRKDYPNDANTNVEVYDFDTGIEVDAKVRVNVLSFKYLSKSGVRFRIYGADTNVSSLTTAAISGWAKNDTFVFDGLRLSASGDLSVPSGASIVVTNAAYVSFSGHLTHSYSTSSTLVCDRSTLSPSDLRLDAGCVTVDNATLLPRGYVFFGLNASAVERRLLFKGRHPLMRMGNNNMSCCNTSGDPRQYIDFEIPLDGYAEPPIQGYSTDASYKFAYCSRYDSVGTYVLANISMRIVDKSPCFRTMRRFFQPLVRWETVGIATNRLTLVPPANPKSFFVLSSSTEEPYHWKAPGEFTGTPVELGVKIPSSGGFAVIVR